MGVVPIASGCAVCGEPSWARPLEQPLRCRPSNPRTPEPRRQALGFRPRYALAGCGRHRGQPPRSPDSRRGGRKSASLGGVALWRGDLPSGASGRLPTRNRSQGRCHLSLVRGGAGDKPGDAQPLQAGPGQWADPGPAFHGHRPISQKPGGGITDPLLCFPAFGCVDLGRPSRAAYPRFAVQALKRLF
jgi:hypothetical protein